MSDRIHARLKLRCGQPLDAEDALDLLVEIRVVLGCPPQQEEEVARVHGVHLALLHPLVDHRALLVGQRLDLLVLLLGQHVGAANHLLGEDFGGHGMLAGVLDLHLDVVGDGLLGFALRGDLLERLDPFVAQFGDDAPVDLPLGGEVVVQVRPRQAGGPGDVVHAGAVEAAGGQQFLRGAENPRLLLVARLEFTGHGRQLPFFAMVLTARQGRASADVRANAIIPAPGRHQPRRRILATRRHRPRRAA